MLYLSYANVTTALGGRLGPEAVVGLVRAFGGKRIEIPKHPGGKLREALGTDAAGVLVEEFGGQAVDVPSWGQFARIQRAAALRQDVLASDESANTIAFRHGVGSAYVRKLRARLRKGRDPQPPVARKDPR